MEFIEIWSLLAPEGEFKRREAACRRLWAGYDANLRQRIYNALSEAKAKGDIIKENPYFAIEDAALAIIKLSRFRPQILSFDEYYSRYGTTEEKDGWTKKFLPEERKTIYIKPFNY